MYACAEDGPCAVGNVGEAGSRLENHVGHRELYEMGEEFISSFIKSYGGDIPAKIILDLDDCNSNTYGAQQLSLFNQYYGKYCYMPLFIFEGIAGGWFCLFSDRDAPISSSMSSVSYAESWSACAKYGRTQ